MAFLRGLYDSFTSVINEYVSEDARRMTKDFISLDEIADRDNEFSRKDNQIKDLEKSVAKYELELSASIRENEDLRLLAQYLKSKNRDIKRKCFSIEKRVAAFDMHMRESICNLIERGIHPLTAERKGCYAFIDRHGKLISMSHVARKVLGYSDEKQINYHNLISSESFFELAEIRSKKTVASISFKPVEGENITVKDVHVSPLNFGDVYAGSIVDFRGLTLIEKARSAWFEGRAKKLIEDINTRFKRYENG
ncbi:hypothetical protein EXS72_02490 [Candidatus Pacearchaeota archaeon]|nr:hypothetical protein [Candidatus Pacearchaeota archaeon]